MKESNKEILKLKRMLKDKQESGEERECRGSRSVKNVEREERGSRSTEYVKSLQEKIKKMEEEKDGFFAPKVL